MATGSLPPSPLAPVLAELAAKAATYRLRSINEQATKNALISPLLAQLGWGIHDLDMVTPEWRPSLPGFRGNPVDYALLGEDGVRPVALVEAKALGERLDLHASQAAAYAQQAGVEWAILTNGDEWRVYRAGGWGRGTALPSWLVLRCTLVDPAAPELLGQLTCTVLRDGSFGRWARTQQDLRVLKATFEALVATPDPLLSEALGRDLTGGAARVRELWTHVRASLVVDGLVAAVAVESVVVPVVPAISPAAPPSVAAPEPARRMVAAKAPSPAAEMSETDGEWISAATPPTPGTKPQKVKVLGQVTEVGSWTELLQVVATQAAAADPARFALAFDAPEFAGRKCRRVGATSEGMRKAVPVGGGYVEAHLSGGGCVEISQRIAEFVTGSGAWYSVVAE